MRLKIISVQYKKPKAKKNTKLCMMPPDKDMNLDTVLSELGNVGKFQLINFVFIGIAILLSSIVSLTFVFAAGELNYR